MQYQIIGEPLPVVICTLGPGEAMLSESGAMSWMTPNVKMETSSGGGIGKVFGRMLSGENLFLNRFTATEGDGTVAFASSFPGSIRAFEIGPGHEVIAQKSSFLASATTVDMSIFFQKKLGAGFFGGEGFIMQKFSGAGIVFLEIDGTAVEYDLAAGQSMIVDTGYLAAMSSTCQLDVRAVPGLKNMLFGGEGIFNTVITGPGHIILQTMPIRQVAKVLKPFLAAKR